MVPENQSVGAGTMEPPRRGFFYKVFAVALGAVLPVPAIVAAIASLIDPILPGRKKSASGSFFPALSTDAVTAEPQLVQIIADLQDAWNIYPKTPIGAVYIQKTSDVRLAFEIGWKPVESLKAALEKAAADRRDLLLKELLEAEFALAQRQEERGGHEWAASDTNALIEKYGREFPRDLAAVQSVGRAAKWEAGLRVFNVACPHAGCAVDFQKAGAAQGAYFCPCHNSQFAPDGTRDVKSPSARDLDKLDYIIEDGKVTVRFMNFKAGEKAKHAV